MSRAKFIQKMAKSLNVLLVGNASIWAKIENTRISKWGEAERNEMDLANNAFRDGNSSPQMSKPAAVHWRGSQIMAHE